MFKQTYRVCFCFRRRFKLAVAEAPEEIKILYGKYSENGIMTVGQLHRFMVDVQKEDKATKEDAQAIVDSLREIRHLNIHHRKGLSLEAFFKYLFGDINSPLSPNLGVHQDMNAPLSHYFIHTGHNSYLTGNQLSSDCSDVPIVNALKKGVRVIELDIWPNSSKNNVDVLHGKTLTTPVQLLKCLRSIHEYAFVASDYPVILTLEDHLTPDLQAKVAQMITETFGDTLFYQGSVCYKEFPSPESLKRRIVVSTKPPKEYLEVKETKEKDSEVPKAKVSEDDSWGKEDSILERYVDDENKGGLDNEDSDQEEDFDEEDKSQGQEEDFDEEDKSQGNATPEYKELIAIRAKKRRGGFDDYLKIENEVKRLSLNEQKFEKATITHGKQIVRYTQRNLLRIFPKATRFDSSNYRPVMGWIHGAQMVALNMQGHGRSLWMMQGLFRANGGCGYVKKPDFLLKSDSDDEIFNPKAERQVKTTLKVTIYMGDGWYYDFRQTHFDRYSPPDFYARVGIAGVPADAVMKKTKTLEDNWIPAWNETFEFPLTVPELALLRIEVHEYDMSEKDDFAGQTCLPVWELRQGIRAVPLHDHKGEKYRSVKLLMRFDFI